MASTCLLTAKTSVTFRGTNKVHTSVTTKAMACKSIVGIDPCKGCMIAGGLANARVGRVLRADLAVRGGYVIMGSDNR